MQAPFLAAIFDLDGVITDTASLHERAWHEVTGCTHEEYLACFDGRKREAGLQTYFASTNVYANGPYMQHLCDTKDALYVKSLASGVHVYPDVKAILDSLTCPMAVTSSSKNAKAVIRAAGLADRFSVVIDGNGAGKPASYTAAAEALGIPFSDCAVFEDSPQCLMEAISLGCRYAIYTRKDRR